MRGIVAVTSNPVVGSFVILHDEKMVTQEAVLARLNELFSAHHHLKREPFVRAVASSGMTKPRSLLRIFEEYKDILSPQGIASLGQGLLNKFLAKAFE